MRAHLDELKEQTPNEDAGVDWSVINTSQLKSFTPGKRAGLQLADAVAGGFFSAVQPGNYGFAEDRYACILKRNVYRHKGRHHNYGLKFWPMATRELLATESHLSWANTEYR
jgi:hypothetical protein